MKRLLVWVLLLGFLGLVEARGPSGDYVTYREGGRRVRVAHGLFDAIETTNGGNFVGIVTVKAKSGGSRGVRSARSLDVACSVSLGDGTTGTIQFPLTSTDCFGDYSEVKNSAHSISEKSWACDQFTPTCFNVVYKSWDGLHLTGTFTGDLPPEHPDPRLPVKHIRNGKFSVTISN